MRYLAFIFILFCCTFANGQDIELKEWNKHWFKSLDEVEIFGMSV